MPRNVGAKKFRQLRSDGTVTKPRGYVHDATPRWIRDLLGIEVDRFAWDPPPKWTIKHSRQTAQHIEYLKGRGISVEHRKSEKRHSRGNRRAHGGRVRRESHSKYRSERGQPADTHGKNSNHREAI
jgi:hypothetical protein